MEHCFTGAICLIFFLGHLQAKSIFMDDLDQDLHLLLTDVSCGNNVTFTSPKYEEKHCCTAAYKCIMEQMEKAKTNCTDKNKAIVSTLETLEEVYSGKCPQSVGTNTSDCKWENPKSLADFVADIKGFGQFLNTLQYES